MHERRTTSPSAPQPAGVERKRWATPRVQEAEIAAVTAVGSFGAAGEPDDGVAS